MTAVIDLESISVAINEMRRDYDEVHLVVTNEWYTLALREFDYAGVPVIRTVPVEVKIEDGIPGQGWAVRSGPAYKSWSDPDVDPIADIKVFMAGGGGSISVSGGGGGGSGGGTFSGGGGGGGVVVSGGGGGGGGYSKPPYLTEPPEPEGGWVVPPTCRCDMNLCECNTPDPGPSFDEYRQEKLAELPSWDREAVSEAWATLTAAFQQVARAVQSALEPLYRVVQAGEDDKHAGHARKPMLNAPPPPSMPSVNAPPAFHARHRSGHRGR